MGSLDVVDVTVSFGPTTVLDGAGLHVDAGEVVGLLGPSGSGKSTLLRVIAGLLPPDHGTVLIDGVDVTALPTHRRGVGMVFQDEQLFPHLTVRANVAFGLKMAGVPAAERRRRAGVLLELVGLAGFDDRRIADLSGGEAKRVALARSLAPAPKVLLLDEPLTGLDRELHDRLAVEVRAILATAGTTAVWVTHDAGEAAVATARVVHLPGALTVVELRAGETHALRRAVLRDATPATEVVFAGDDAPGTFHLGVRRGTAGGGDVVAVSTWMPNPYRGRPDEPAYQLRGMATAHRLQGRGAGALLIAAGLERCRSRGATLVWARARRTALGFYERQGFEVAGDEYVDEATQLPHRDVLITLDPTVLDPTVPDPSTSAAPALPARPPS